MLLTVATIGLSQLLIVCGLLLPRLWGRDILTDQRIPDPISAHLTIGSQSFGGSEIVAVILAPLMIGALALFLAIPLGVSVLQHIDILWRLVGPFVPTVAGTDTYLDQLW